MSGSTVRDQTRAVVLAALMVLSVFAGTIVLSGLAVADVSSFSNANATDAEVNGGSAQNVISVDVTSDTTSENVTIALSSLPSNVTVTSAQASGAGNLTVNEITVVDDGTGDANAQINVSVNGSATNQTLEVTVNYDVSTSNDNTTVTATVNDAGSGTNAGSTSATFNFDTAPPTATSASTADANNDGSVDTIDVTFSENLSASTVNASDFALESGSADSASVTGNIVTLAVSGVGDTAATPNVTVADGSVEDTAGNQLSGDQTIEATDSADPIVTATSLNQTEINDSDAPTTVSVSATFSENVTGLDPSDVQLSGRNVTGSISGDTFTGTVDIPDNNQDVRANLTISGLTDTSANSNSLVTFDQQAAIIDTDDSLTLQSASTADMDDDGIVDTVRVTFSDSVNDQSVLDAIAADNFNLKSGTVQGLASMGDNDATVALEVTGVGDTGATDEVTLFSDSIEDTVGNPGPNSPTGIRVADDARPVVESLSINDTDDGSAASSTVVINESDVSTDLVINATFSENLNTSDPTVELVINGNVRTGTTDFVSSSGDESLSVITAGALEDNNEEASVFVRVTGGDDGAGNAVETFNQSRITLDTASPQTAVDASLADGLQNGTIDISNNVSITGDDIAQIEVNITDASGSTFETFSSKSALNTFLSSFDTTQFEDGTVTVAVNATDTAGNLGNTDSGTLDVDNKAPVVTINEPAETTAKQSDSALAVNVTIDEPNIAGNATVVLEGGNNTIVYDVPVSDGDNTFQLKLNTSANATAPNSILPNQTATNGSFETKVVYDLSVTVDDGTGQSTTATQPDALFLDDTPPENFTLLAPDQPTEFQTGNDLVIAYGYTENNTNKVTVSLTNETGAVANVTVDESQYVDDGVIKSFELDLFNAFDTSTLADGRYNVSVTVVDEAGNRLTESTTNAPVAINNVDKQASDPKFNSGPTVTSTNINATTEQVTVEVAYNISVPQVTDAGDLDQRQDSLTSVEITADVGTLIVDYYDASAGKYKQSVLPLKKSLNNANATANADITETITVNASALGPELDEGDRVLDRQILAFSEGRSRDVLVQAVDSGGDSVTGSDEGSPSSKFVVNRDPVEPEIESVEVTGADTPAPTLEITFTRPVVEVAGEDLTPSDFGYQDVSGDGSNFIDSVSDVDGDTTIEVTLNESVTAGDVGADIVSLQDGNVLESTKDVAVSPDNGTVQETTAPSVTGLAQVQDNASQVVVTFDQPVQAGDGGNLTAANFTYRNDSAGGASSIVSVEQIAPDTVLVTLDQPVNVGDERESTPAPDEDDIVVPAGEVFDRFGNTDSSEQAVGLDDNVAPSGVVVETPETQTIKQSTDTLQISYRYTENLQNGTDKVVVQLIDQDSEEVAYRYSVEDDQYVDDGVLKTIAIDLDSGPLRDKLADGEYTVRVKAEDDDGNEAYGDANGTLVINDEAPEVTGVSVNPSNNVAPDETIDVSYNYQNPGVNATSVTVHIVDTDDVGNFTSGDFANATFAQVTKQVDHASGRQTVQVDLSGLSAIEDNDDYAVFVTATDESGLTNLNTSADPIIEGPVSRDFLDVNAEQPTIDSVETNAGSDTVTVTFSEPVVATDGEISLDDFAYQDVSDSGASAIEDVQQVGPQTVELTLDSPVTADDLGSDLVNVRLNALADTDGQNARIVPLNATALADTTDPVVDVTAGEVNAQNDENYAVTVTTEPLSEPTDITVTVTGPDNGTVTAQASAQGTTSVSLNVSTLADGELDIEAVATDAAGNNDSASTTAVKDTVAPTVEVAAANPGGSVDDGGKTRVVFVTFSEPVTGVSADAFDLGNESYTVDDVIFNPFVTGDQAAVLLLNQSVTPEVINDSSAFQVSAPGVTDEVGNQVANGVKLTDQDVASSSAPDHKPGIEDVSSATGSATVTIVFDEVVEAGDGTALSAANLTYIDNNNASAGEVVNVTQTSPTTVQVTVDQPLTDADRALDRIGVEAGEVFDLAGTSAPNETVPFGLKAGLSASSSGDTVTVQVTTGTNVSDALGGSVEIAEVNAELAELEGFVLEDRFSTSLSAGDFTEVEPGVFQATVQVPEDGAYSVSGLFSGELQTVETVVDTQAPRPIDATILSVTSEAQLDDTRNTTRLRVLFNEPIQGSAISPDDVTIEGFDGKIVAVEDAGPFGAVEVVLEGKLQTGDSPAISIAGSSYTDLSGTTGVAGGSTTVHTDVLQLDEEVNFVSVPAASGGLDISELPLDKIESISRYNAQTGEFEVFIPGAPNNPFTTLDGGEGYIIRMEDNTTATVPINVANEPTGQNGPNAVELSEGFNLVGHYQEDQQSVQQALSSVTAGENGNFTDVVFVVLRHNEETGGFTYESFRAGEFSTLEDGEAYWVFVTDDQTYTEAPFDNSGGLVARGNSSRSAGLA